jgi:hypothetical protein|tara:strand:- start:154 stop:390 length:237 start_codon:yes stop_codon:yes gene_type:complete
MPNNVEIISQKKIEAITLSEGDSAIIFRKNGDSEAFLGVGDDEESKETRYAIAFCVYALSSDLFRKSFELHIFDGKPS